MGCDQNRTRSCPYGPMDKAPAYGAGDSGFESQYGLNLFLFRSLQTIFFVRVREGWLTISQADPSPYRPRLTLDAYGLPWMQKRLQQSTKGGDARIELATSCTRSRNHTTRPITLEPAWAGQTTVFHPKRERDVLELNQRPIGLQPIALPLS